jgi:hypothetical protein
MPGAPARFILYLTLWLYLIRRTIYFSEVTTAALSAPEPVFLRRFQ